MSPTFNTFSCEHCGNNYKHRQGLWKHSKVCKPKHIEPNADKVVDEPDQTIVSDQSLMSFLIKQNQEFKDMIVEQNKTIVDAIKQCSSSISNSTVNWQIYFLKKWSKIQSDYKRSESTYSIIGEVRRTLVLCSLSTKIVNIYKIVKISFPKVKTEIDFGHL